MQSPEEIRAICQRGKHVDPGWYRIHRRVSIYLTWLLLHTRIRPNQVTGLMMLFGLMGAVLLAFPHIGVNAAGFGLLYLAFLLDKVDGEIARYRGQQSITGILLDRLHHLVVEPAIIIAAAYRDYLMHGSVGVLFAGFATVIFANVIDEHQHLAPYILFKHVRETRGVPALHVRRLTRGAAATLKALKPLKGFRMFIVVLPLLALMYAVEWLAGVRATGYYLYVSGVALGIYLAAQSRYYYSVRLEEETEGLIHSIVEGQGWNKGGGGENRDEASGTKEANAAQRAGELNAWRRA